MKKLSKKQIFVIISILIIALAGIALFFIITRNNEKQAKKVSIAIYTAKGDKKFVLAEVESNELSTYFDHQKYTDEGLPDLSSAAFSFYPVNESEFLNDYVLNNEFLVGKSQKQSDYYEGEIFDEYLFLFDDEYFMLDCANPIEARGFTFVRCWNIFYNLQSGENVLFFWPGRDGIFDENDLIREWSGFDTDFSQVPVHSFDDLVEFYERIDETYYKIDKEKQEIYVKGIEELTGKVTEDYFVKLIVDDEGIQIVIL